MRNGKPMLGTAGIPPFLYPSLSSPAGVSAMLDNLAPALFASSWDQEVESL